MVEQRKPKLNPKQLYKVSLEDHPELRPYDVSRANISAQHSVEGGGTGREFPRNLLSPGEEPWNKWYQAQAKNSWVAIELPSATEVVGFGFKSATDCPWRDPEEVTVSILSLGQAGKFDFIELGTIGLDFESKRSHTIALTGVRVFSSAFRFEFRNFRGGREMQLAQIIFYH